ncbi:MAG: hypothetical protein CEO19_357 [Parcubacteria group bacterium Gr01-1014_73]|nr:MAG: hypothetical protein CEO19_357 [Parcubacteria group bacterium Gr01-1014_73]
MLFVYTCFMTTRAIFNMDSKLKSAAMKKARGRGLSLSAFMNLAARAFVAGRIDIDVLSEDLLKSRDDIRLGRVISQDKLFHRLGI